MDVLRSVRLRDKDGNDRYELSSDGETVSIRSIGIHFPHPLVVPLEELDEGVRALLVSRE